MSSDHAVISVDALHKSYRLGERASYGRLTESLAGLPKRIMGGRQESYEAFWAITDVSFEVSEGEVLGIVGRNGAGKSTLLKILSRVTRPTSGTATLTGRVGSLLEIGTGFHPELTGRENIFMSGAILGMRRREIERRFDEIAEFADIGPFLDTPVKRYSSGMQVRLGFAVTAFLETEILLVDEVLAVGDADFQRKSESRMSKAARDGRTILFVSHNLGAVKNICPRAIFLDKGTVREDGDTPDVIEAYLRGSEDVMAVALADRSDRKGSGDIQVVDAWIEYRGARSGFMVTGEQATLVIEFESQRHPRDIDINIGLFDLTNTGALFLGSHLTGFTIPSVPRRGTFKVDFDKVALLPGTYTANTYITSGEGLIDWVVDAFQIRVEPGDFFGSGQLPGTGYGHVAHHHTWRLEES